MRIIITGKIEVVLDEHQLNSDKNISELIDQTRTLNRIVAAVLLDQANHIPGAPSEGISSRVRSQEQIDIEEEVEPVDFGRVEATVMNGMKQVSAIEAKNSNDRHCVRCGKRLSPGAVSLCRDCYTRSDKTSSSEKKPGGGWTPERRAQAAERMKKTREQLALEGRLPKGKGTAPKLPDAVPVSAEALGLIGGKAAEKLIQRPDARLRDEADYEAEELAELEKPIPSPEEIFGRNVLAEAQRGDRPVEQVRQHAMTTPGAAGRLARA